MAGILAALATLLLQSAMVKASSALLPTPPMGWLSWESFKCGINCNEAMDNCISEILFKEMADVMVSEGYVEAGYNRINIDDCWMSPSRTLDGHLVPDETRFPNGIKSLAEYMHRRSMKLGIYENIGRKTCMGFPGSRDYFTEDAETFASWDVDMVKMDGCNEPPAKLASWYKKFGKFLRETGKPIVYSCSWPYYEMFYSNSLVKSNFTEIEHTCNTWRLYHDISADWPLLLKIIDFFGDHQSIFRKHVKPGHFADPDMLLVGDPRLTVNQARAHMGIWAILAAPLLISVDLRNIASKYKEILLNKHVIAINQDKAGIPGERIFSNSSMDIWLRKLPNAGHDRLPSFAVGFLNKEGVGAVMTLNLNFLSLNSSYTFLDVFTGESVTLEPPSDIVARTPGESLTLYRADPTGLE